MKSLFLAVLTLAAGSFAAQASVITIDPVTIYHEFQQITNKPCVIGDPSCVNGSLPFTVLPAGASSYDALSPVYTAGQIIAAIGGGAFSIGYDINQTSVVQTLGLVTMSVNGVVVDSTNFVSPVPVPPTVGGGNGNGYADYLLNGFTDLSTLSPTAQIQFHLVMPLANDGREELFLIDAPTSVPEPLTLSMVGMGLLALGIARKRKIL